MTRVRLDWVTTTPRTTVDVRGLGTTEVFHYSIPMIEAIGDGALEPVSQIDSSKLLLTGGEVLISKLNPRKARVLVAEAHEVPTVCSGEFIALVSTADIDRDFLWWRLQSNDVTQELDSRVRSVTRSHQRIDPQVLTKMWLELPSLEEQRYLVGWLERACRDLDNLLIELVTQRRLIEERDKLAVLHLVTGRDVRGARTLQGAWWMGATPASWQPLKIARNFHTGSGTTPKSGEARFYGGGHLWLTTTECRDAEVSETIKTVTDEALSEYPALKFYPAGSLVVAMYGSIGKLAILGAPMTVNQACCVLHSPKGLDTEFTYWWLWAHRQELIGLGVGGSQANISQEIVRQLVVPAPVLSEQRRIVSQVKELRQHSERMFAESDKQMDLLNERRIAIITAAMAGQMEVS